MKTKTKNIFFIIMAASYMFSAGALINGIFNTITGGFNNPRTMRMFIISVCFFMSGKIIRMVLKRNE